MHLAPLSKEIIAPTSDKDEQRLVWTPSRGVYAGFYDANNLELRV